MTRTNNILEGLKEPIWKGCENCENLQAELEKKTAALEKYGKHFETCLVAGGTYLGGSCDCGFKQAFERGGGDK